MLAVKARVKRQKDEYGDREKFAAVVYLLLPPSQVLLHISVGLRFYAEPFKGFTFVVYFLWAI